MTISSGHRTSSARLGIVATSLSALALGLASVVAPVAAADVGVYSIGAINGHTAYAIGPFDTGGACLQTATRLSDYGAYKFGARFGTCYQDSAGKYYAISPWGQ